MDYFLLCMTAGVVTCSLLLGTGASEVIRRKWLATRQLLAVLIRCQIGCMCLILTSSSWALFQTTI